MLKQCQDSYSTQFTQFPAMLAYHEETRKASLWERTEVNRLRVAALDKASPLYEDPSSFDSAVSQEAIADTAENLGLAIQMGERYFPLRDTAYKSLLDRAKINGTALPKLARAKLAEVLNSCLELHKDSALLLIRDEKVSALLMGLQYPIHIGGMVAIEHRRQSKVPDFVDALDMLFAQFGDSVARLSGLLTIHLDNPVNAMTAVCKKLAMPKKAAIEAIAMFETANGNASASAHDVFMAMQEILFNLKVSGAPESKLLSLQENMARALTLRWSDYDLAKQVNW